MSESSSVVFAFPELKSIVAVFVGIFCILCFKKLIGFGIRWKNILIDWGYRSLNVPSLWSRDTYVDQSRGDGDDQANSPISASWSTSTNRGRVPALRLPDAWPNFLLTWMYLNLDTMSSLVPAWVSAINEELERTTTMMTPSSTVRGTGPRDNDRKQQSSQTGRQSLVKLELGAVQQPSVPPRLSSIETSASRSTRELHFNSTFTSSEVYLKLTLSRSRPNQFADDSEVSSSHLPASATSNNWESYLIHLKQVSCRVQVICAALEGGYVLLSWRLVSPLLTQRLALLNINREPVTSLPGTEIRWIKDTVYLSIQSAVTRVLLSPLYFTAVQHSLSPRHITPRDMVSPNGNPVSTIRRRSETATTVKPNSMHIRVVYALLLEPTELPSGPLFNAPFRCQIRSNPSFTDPPAATAMRQTTESADAKHGASWNAKRTATLLTTSKVRLKSRAMSAEHAWPGRNQPGMTNSHLAIWNEDAYIPMEKIKSDLLEVVVYTETDGSPSNRGLCGRAVLPLPKSNEPSTRSQHVLLIDCYTGGHPDDSWPVRQEETEMRAKLMLILRVQLFANNTSETSIVQSTQHHLQGTILPPRPKPVDQIKLGNTLKKKVLPSATSPITSALSIQVPLTPSPLATRSAQPGKLSREELASFMSPPRWNISPQGPHTPMNMGLVGDDLIENNVNGSSTFAGITYPIPSTLTPQTSLKPNDTRDTSHSTGCLPNPGPDESPASVKRKRKGLFSFKLHRPKNQTGALKTSSSVEDCNSALKDQGISNDWDTAEASSLHSNATQKRASGQSRIKRLFSHHSVRHKRTNSQPRSSQRRNSLEGQINGNNL